MATNSLEHVVQFKHMTNYNKTDQFKNLWAMGTWRDLEIGCVCGLCICGALLRLGANAWTGLELKRIFKMGKNLSGPGSESSGAAGAAHMQGHCTCAIIQTNTTTQTSNKAIFEVP